MSQVSHILRKYDAAQWGGTETAVHRLIQGLAGHGIHSRVHAPHHSAPTTAHDPLATVCQRLQRYHAFVPVAGISPAQRAALISWGGNVCSWDLLGHLLTSRSDLIHSHALNRIAGIGLLAARLKRVPHTITLHGGALDVPAEVTAQLTAPLTGGWEWGKALGYLLRSRRVLELTDAIFTCNPREAQLLQQKYPQQRIIVQPHSVPAAQYAQDCTAAALQAYPQIAGRDLIIKVARLDPAKNLPWLLRQLPAIRQRHPRAMLALVGAGTTQSVVDELHAEIQRLGLQNDVLLTGGLATGSAPLIGLLQQARVFALSSTAEPFGIVILEAWAAGTPVLASRTSGPSALIDHGRNGLLYDLSSEAEFHHGLDAILTDSSLAHSLRTAARATVLAQYDVPSVSARVARVYEELIEQKQKQPRTLSPAENSL